MDWLCSVFLTPEQCVDSIWARLVVTWGLVIVAQVIAFWAGMNHQRWLYRKYPPRTNTMNFYGPVYADPEFAKEITEPIGPSPTDGETFEEPKIEGNVVITSDNRGIILGSKAEAA